MKQTIFMTAVAVLATSILSSAYATSMIENDALAVKTAKISLTSAIAIAEQHVAGKASRAEFEKYKNQWVFDVEVVSAEKVMDVKIDPESGKVLAATEDRGDHDDDGDKDDGDDDHNKEDRDHDKKE